MKKVFVVLISACAVICVCALASGRSLVKSSLSELSKANVEALAAPQKAEKKVETVADFARETLGCPGGKNKCFSGSITFKGATLEGTWYLK